MSKSLGNIVEPQTIFNSLGADVLRLWVAATDYRGEMSVSDEILKRTADSYRRMRNTARFLLGNLHGFDPASDVIDPADMLDLDRWAVAAAHDLHADVVDAYERYEFHQIYQKVHNFCVVQMGGFYLDILKDRLYTMQPDSLGRRSAQTAMYHVAESMVRWLAPILSFTSEEVWAELPGERDISVMLSTWHEPPEVDSTKADWNAIIGVREAVSRELERSRESGAIGSSLAAGVDLYCDAPLSATLDVLGDELRFVFITSEARVHPAADRPSHLEPVADGLWVEITAVSHDKCQRCWHRRADVGADTGHPALCGRCVVNVEGDGEGRQWA